MKNLGLLYQAIKEVEERTLFKFEEIDDDNDLHFSYHREDVRMILSSERMYIDPQECSIILEYGELCSIMKLMQVLKEFE